MNRVLTCLFLVYAFNCTAQNKPNIIFILADDLGWNDVGFMGNKVIETPNIDDLAKNGMVFSQGYSSGPMCTPTRASIMTGKYSRDLDMFAVIPSLKPNPDWDYGVPRGDNYNFFNTGNRYDYNVRSKSYLPLEELTIAELLKKQGYNTCYIGKWHLGHQPYHPIYQGFDIQIGTTNYGSPPTYFYPYETVRNKQKRTIEDLNKNGEKGEYLTDRLTDEAIEYVYSSRESAFFLSLNYHNPHSPFIAKERLISYYETKGLSGRDAIYAAMVHSIDENIGKLVAAIKEYGLEKNTLIIFTSDNGGVGGVSHLKPLRGAKGNLYEGGIRVPVLFNFPGKIAPGVDRKTLVTSIDYLPTILGFAGVDRDSLDVRGENLHPVLTDNSPIEGRALIWQFPQLNNDLAIRKGDFKLLKNSRNGHRELYRLSSDPSERNNLIKQYPEKGKELDLLLKIYLQNDTK